MNAALPSPFLEYDRKVLRDRIAHELDLPKLYRRIDETPGLAGAGVVYIDRNYTAVELRPFTPLCRVRPIKVVLREAPRYTSTVGFVDEIKHNKRESRLVGELVNTGLSCSAAVLGWIVVFGSGAVIPLTGGGSSAITYVAIGAATASTLQCASGVVRSGLEVASPSTNDMLDSSEWYQQMTAALDLISLGGAIVSGASTIRMVQTLRTTTQKSALTVLQGLSRPERRRLTIEVIRLNYPGISNAKLKALLATGAFPSRYSNSEITRAVALQLKDAVGGTLTLAGSAYSGTVGALAVGIYEEVTD